MLRKTTQNIEWGDLNQQKQHSLLWLGGFPLEMPLPIQTCSLHCWKACLLTVTINVLQYCDSM